MRYRSFDEIRAALAQELGHRPAEEIWDLLFEKDYVREVWEETAGIDNLAEEYRKFARIPEPLLQPSKSATKSRPRQVRLQVLSDLIARQAAAEQVVVAFRRQHLTEGLLRHEEVDAWITKQADEDGPASHYLTIPVPEDHELTQTNGRVFARPPLTVSVKNPATQVKLEILAYASADDQWVRRIAVRHGGTLDRLRKLSESLARRFKWHEAHAATFVLTGSSPLLSSFRGGFRLELHQPISSRITMEIDPTHTPQEVAERYKQLRDSLIGARYRQMSVKHLRLAEFFGGHKPEGSTWSALMKRWNQSQDQAWRYTRFETFARDCKQAWGRLMGRDLLKYPDL